MTIDRDAVEKIRAALDAAKDLSKTMEGLTACRSDDDYVWGAQEKIDLALEALSSREATEGGEAEPFVSGRGWENLSCDDQYALAQQIAANVGYVLTPEPEPEPFPVDATDPSFADALNDSEVRVWINACNHEPARQALRQLLAYRVRGVSTPLRSASIPPSGVAVKPLGADWSYMPSYGDLDWEPVVQAVAEAMYADRAFDIGLDPSRHIGHQMVPSINFNSLNRIISAFVRSSGVAEARALEAAARVAEGSKPIVHGNYYRGQREQADKIATAIRNLIPKLSKEAE